MGSLLGHRVGQVRAPVRNHPVAGREAQWNPERLFWLSSDLNSPCDER